MSVGGMQPRWWRVSKKIIRGGVDLVFPLVHLLRRLNQFLRGRSWKVLSDLGKESLTPGEEVEKERNWDPKK